MRDFTAKYQKEREHKDADIYLEGRNRRKKYNYLE